MKCDTSVLSHS